MRFQNRMDSWMRRHFELSRGGMTNIQAMEGLRGFAVLLAFFAHYVAVMLPWISENSWTYSVAGLLRNIGHAGVDLFFVMSGYLIYAALIKRERKFLEFFKGRVLRVYPAFLFMFAVYVVLSLALPHHTKASFRRTPNRRWSTPFRISCSCPASFRSNLSSS